MSFGEGNEGITKIKERIDFEPTVKARNSSFC
jgi:hypothetical protein